MTWLIFKRLKYVYFKDCINHSDTNKGTLKVPNLLIKEEDCISFICVRLKITSIKVIDRYH